MKEYNFEYTNQAMAYLLFVLAFGTLFLGIFIFSLFFKDFLSPILAVTISLAISFLVFWLNKRKIKKYGTVKLMDDSMELELDKAESINFSDLRYYYIYDGKNGPVFTLGFRNKKKIKIGANDNFCNADPFSDFLINFQSTIENFKEKNKVDIIHLKSVFARKNSVYVLASLTIAVILGFCFTTMPLMIIPIGTSFGLVGGWLQYFKLKQENNLTDI